MVNEGFCEPCQRMLAEQHVPTKREDPGPHHHDGESFRKAIDMGCHICIQCWVHSDGPNILSPTSYHVWTSDVHYFEITHRKSLLGSSYVDEGTLFCFQPWTIEHARMVESGHTTSHSDTWLSDNTGSDQTFGFLVSKYKNCVSRHRKCSRLQTGRSLPTRLLDVGREDVGLVHLVDRESVLPGATYSTLSHCWGESVPLKLTKSTETMLYSGIAVGQLPKTFRNAVAVARKLDIRYLWIDSLCIYQDSIDDWSLEAAAMYNVYQNAILNIAATAAVGSHIGLFHHRKPREVEPFKIDVAWPSRVAEPDVVTPPLLKSFLCWRYRLSIDDIDEAPLNKRAWVMQERMLSHRIVHYTSTVLYWECFESFVSEIHQENLPLEDSSSPDFNTRGLKLLLNPTVENGGGRSNYTSAHQAYSKEPLYAAWQTFGRMYSVCSLSHPKDKFVALAGIVRKLSGMLQDELVAGLWKSRLLKELCWVIVIRRGIPQSDVWLAPSWSWASCNGISRYFSMDSDGSRDMAEVVHVDAQAEESGALKTGFLILRCRPVAALLQDKPREVLFKSNGVHLQHLTEHHRGFNMDYSHYTQGCRDVLLVALCRAPDCESTKEDVGGLILVPSAKESTAFERIGMFFQARGIADPCDSVASQILTRYEDAEEQVITII